MKIRTLMIDLQAGRNSCFANGHLRTYQQVWQDIRTVLASTYQSVISGYQLEDNILRVQMFGVDVARFEIK